MIASFPAKFRQCERCFRMAQQKKRQNILSSFYSHTNFVSLTCRLDVKILPEAVMCFSTHSRLAYLVIICEPMRLLYCSWMWGGVMNSTTSQLSSSASVTISFESVHEKPSSRRCICRMSSQWASPVRMFNSGEPVSNGAELPFPSC